MAHIWRGAQNINAQCQEIITEQNTLFLTIQAKEKHVLTPDVPGLPDYPSPLTILDQFHTPSLIEEAGLSNPFSQWTDGLENVERNFLLTVSFVGFQLKEQVLPLRCFQIAEHCSDVG